MFFKSADAVIILLFSALRLSLPLFLCCGVCVLLVEVCVVFVVCVLCCAARAELWSVLSCVLCVCSDVRACTYVWVSLGVKQMRVRKHRECREKSGVGNGARVNELSTSAIAGNVEQGFGVQVIACCECVRVVECARNYFSIWCTIFG